MNQENILIDLKERLCNVVDWKDPVHSTYHHLQSINTNISHIANIIESIAATSQSAKVGKHQTWP